MITAALHRPSASTRAVLLALAATLVLCACGNKGPLVLPDKPVEPTAAPAETPAAKPNATPAPAPLDEIPSPLPPSSPPAATDPVLRGADDDTDG